MCVELGSCDLRIFFTNSCTYLTCDVFKITRYHAGKGTVLALALVLVPVLTTNCEQFYFFPDAQQTDFTGAFYTSVVDSDPDSDINDLTRKIKHCKLALSVADPRCLIRVLDLDFSIPDPQH
jgi:hypothetical protein